ncbi:WecB/TagA/CpsF family glycosyltransferase [Bacillus toyonensis]|uniref:WecB/TagA/CpsF family glycosyltransferase n=1 Tax=Bacillus toyonensis TaxID=155322 RepID=UPI001C551D05|nr:WecB/TagA/CpsF family glycosyltransferase [Bacillus toyonensis]
MKKCKILDVEVAVSDIKKITYFLRKNIKNIKGQYICISNVHTTVMAYEDCEYMKIQNGSLYTLADGKPLQIVSKMNGYKDAERITGPDLMEEIFKTSEERGLTHYFYGSTKETLDKLVAELKRKYPYLKIVGLHSPPFRQLTKEEDERIIEEINMKNPDFVWVGLGAPKQEVWMYEHKNSINSLMIGVGAGFDYHAGNIERAPIIMQKLCLEWLYRLMQDPKRLWRRYAIYNSKFIYYILSTGLKKNKKVQ